MFLPNILDTDTAYVFDTACSGEHMHLSLFLHPPKKGKQPCGYLGFLEPNEPTAAGQDVGWVSGWVQQRSAEGIEV